MEKLVARPAIQIGGDSPSVSLTVEEQKWDNKKLNLNYKVVVIADYTMRFLPDTNELVVLKDNEVVYSELLS